MTRLRCVGRYVNDPRGIAYNVGETFDADPALLAFLMADAPGCFEPAQAAGKALTEPPANKMVKSPDKTK